MKFWIIFACISPLMGPKQTEMDEILKSIYEKLELKDRGDGLKSLVIVLGDHGMADVAIFTFLPDCLLILFIEW